MLQYASIEKSIFAFHWNPTSFQGFSCLGLPSYYRNTGIIDRCYYTHLYVVLGIRLGLSFSVLS